MNPITRAIAALAMALAVSAQAAEGITAIVGASVVHPEREAATAVDRDQTVIIAGDRIVAVGPARSTRVPRGATHLDGRGKWIVPGLVDAHVHFFQSGNLYTRPDGADFSAYMPYAKEDQRNRARLPATFRIWLASGVTSVVDIGGPFWNFDVRDMARKTDAAPRVAVAGPLISMVDRVKLDLGDPPIIKITSVREAVDLVRREIDRKADYIKVWFIHRTGDDLEAQEAIVKAAGDSAHAAGIPLAVHATELVTAKAALRAGADYLVHSVDDAAVDDEFIALMKKNNALYCPTLFVAMGYQYALSNTWRPTEMEKRRADPEILASMGDLERMPKEMIPERIAARMANPPDVKPSQTMLDNLRRVRDAGIPVAMGTDAGNIGTLHGPSVFREMELMAQAGLTPLQVLRAATVNGARAMRMERDLGAVEPGKLADLVILDADPTQTVVNLSRIHRVVKGGHVFVPDDLIRSLR
ncbi:MAG TPA: amidohydrolase family protein [Usitatibacter sp.]|nr:amidohydrolase family protein [Usitatibacter sp.]